MSQFLMWAAVALTTALFHAFSGATHITGWLILTIIACVFAWRAWRDVEREEQR